jgi:hypothetical protein
MGLLLRDFAPGPVKYRIWRCVEQKDWQRVAEGNTGTDSDVHIERLGPDEDPRALAIIRVNAVRNDPPDSQYWLALNGDWFASRSVLLPMSSLPSQVLLRFVGSRQGHRDPLQVSVNAGRKAVVEALLNLITAGNYAAARAIGASHLPEVGPLLTGRDEDPMARVVAGYYLLFAGNHEYLKAWCEDFDSEFADIPDGAVIHAWYLLRSLGDPSLALDRLIAATSRGVPFYTCGLRLLVDGLMLFRQQEDAPKEQDRTRFDAAWEFSSRYASVADWAQPTTTVLSPTPYIPMRPHSDNDIVAGGIRLHERR